MLSFPFEDFLASVDLSLLAESLSQSWGWMEPLRGLRPVSLTLAGDVFLVDAANAIYLLDTNYAVVERVASSPDQFRARLQDETFFRSITRANFVLEMRARNVIPMHNECYLLAVSPALGGAVTADRARAGNFQALLEWLGQLNQSTGGLAIGQPFRLVFPDWPGGAAPASAGSVSKHPRDRASFQES